MTELRREAEPTAEAVLAIDNIALDLPVAGVGSRALAAGLDYVLLTLGIAVVFLAAGIALAATGSAGGRPAWWIAGLVVLFFLLHWGYFTVFEIATRGRTPGKMAVGLRAVGRGGGTPSGAAFLLRNVLRDVDILVGLPLMAADSASRRLGDRLAGTVVVHDRPAAHEPVLGRIPAGWGAKEVALAESFFRRAGDMAEVRRRRLAGRLLAWVERDAPELLPPGASAAGGDPEPALRRALEVGER